MSFLNTLLCVDSYKLHHPDQYPEGTHKICSNWTPRGSRIPGIDRVVFFGLQYFLQEYMSGKGFFDRPKDEVIAEYTAAINGFGTNADRVATLHDLGYFPLEFRALPEGTLCPLRVPMFTVENTDSRFFWLTNYIETIMSATLWLPSTSATLAWRFRKLLDERCKETGGDPSFTQWQGHDFSMRGMGGLEAAMMSGAGHLLSFTGTDTVPAVQFANKYYPGDNGLVGASVPATEHSVMSAGGQESELDTFNRLLDIYPTGIVSVVSDTWNLWDVILKILPTLKERILRRDGKLVIRPDSGDPVKIICGDPSLPADNPASKGVVELLWEIFGGTVTSTGHRLLNSHIGVIYGDAITYERADAITRGLAAKGFASNNIVFGVGSFTYQFNTRDVFGFAMKATHATINGVGRNLFKNPITDDGTKKSLTGRIAVFQRKLCDDEPGRLYAIDNATQAIESLSRLQTVWKDGQFVRRQSFADVRRVLRENPN